MSPLLSSVFCLSSRLSGWVCQASPYIKTDIWFSRRVMLVASPIRSGNRKRHKVRIVGECLSPFPNPATCHGVMKTLSKHPCGTKPRHLLELESAAYARTLRLHKALRARESVKGKSSLYWKKEFGTRMLTRVVSSWGDAKNDETKSNTKCHKGINKEKYFTFRARRWPLLVSVLSWISYLSVEFLVFDIHYR